MEELDAKHTAVFHTSELSGPKFPVVDFYADWRRRCVRNRRRASSAKQALHTTPREPDPDSRPKPTTGGVCLPVGNSSCFFLPLPNQWKILHQESRQCVQRECLSGGRRCTGRTRLFVRTGSWWDSQSPSTPLCFFSRAGQKLEYSRETDFEKKIKDTS